MQHMNMLQMHLHAELHSCCSSLHATLLLFFSACYTPAVRHNRVKGKPSFPLGATGQPGRRQGQKSHAHLVPDAQRDDVANNQRKYRHCLHAAVPGAPARRATNGGRLGGGGGWGSPFTPGEEGQGEGKRGAPGRVLVQIFRTENGQEDSLRKTVKSPGTLRIALTFNWMLAFSALRPRNWRLCM